ncbi:MAG: hypothetical protein EP329_24580 [Deltaproteobacteria bacterium]|nr:MAG: hypothetical protein EP329_24580 [Deltaproteobacteria bacterium]
MSRLEPIAPAQVWSVAHTTRGPGGLHFPGKMVVVRLPSGGLWLHSPVPIDDALAAELAALGPVEHLVAPNTFHHLYLAAAKARYPEATTSGPALLRAKRPDLPLDRDLEDGAPWDDAIAVELVAAGPKMAEAVFLHRPTGTVVACDLAFNLTAVDGWWTRTALRLVGAFGGLRQSRLWRRFTTDRETARAAAERILAWDFERVVVSHGELVGPPDARERLSNALWWLRGGPKPTP